MTGTRKLSKDLLTSILARLSVKSLQRLRAVSKVWCALIKSDNFINAHLLKHQKNGRLMLVKRNLPPPQNDEVLLSFYDPKLLEHGKESCPNLSIPFVKDLMDKSEDDPNYEDVSVVGPCNGLLCIFFGELFMFCNPILREFKQLPRHNIFSPQGNALFNDGVGFGVSEENDYKVVVLGRIDPELHYNEEISTTALVYNSSTNSWRQIDYDANVIPYGLYSSTCGVFLNRACHWNAQHHNPNSPDNVLTFDVTIEVFGLFEYSDCMNIAEGEEPALMVRNQCLSMVRNDCSTDKLLIEIWEMKEYSVKESWTKQFVLGPHVFASAFLCFNNDESVLVEFGQGQLGSCVIHKNDFKESNVQGDEGTLQALMYDGSLVSVNHVIKS